MLLGCLCTAAAVAAAAPLQLTQRLEQQQRQFQYRFDFAGAPQQLSFTLHRDTLANHFRQFRRYQPRLLEQYLWRDVRRHMAQYPDVSLIAGPPGNRLQYQLRSNDAAKTEQIQQELQQLLADGIAEHLQQQYYIRLTSMTGQRYIVPDHLRIMQQSLTDLQPVAQALQQTLSVADARTTIDYVSNWLQQIPYQDLSDRHHSAGNSFSPPLKLLQENRGDCDSKMVLLAALIKILRPELQLAMLYLPDHAVLAVKLAATADDATVTIEGRDYVVVDPTGPAIQPMGKIAQRYQIFTRNQQFNYRLL